MVTDPHWRQWLWFCLRNGLWYGEEGSTRHLWEHIDRLPVVRTLRDDGWEKVLTGITTIEEVIRVSEETE